MAASQRLSHSFDDSGIGIGGEREEERERVSVMRHTYSSLLIDADVKGEEDGEEEKEMSETPLYRDPFLLPNSQVPYKYFLSPSLLLFLGSLFNYSSQND